MTITIFWANDSSQKVSYLVDEGLKVMVDISKLTDESTKAMNDIYEVILNYSFGFRNHLNC